jgi:hypothetical protein
VAKKRNQTDSHGRPNHGTKTNPRRGVRTADGDAGGQPRDHDAERLSIDPARRPNALVAADERPIAPAVGGPINAHGETGAHAVDFEQRGRDSQDSLNLLCEYFVQQRIEEWRPVFERMAKTEPSFNVWDFLFIFVNRFFGRRV